jgi:SAM-dependent methyltransferase
MANPTSAEDQDSMRSTERAYDSIAHGFAEKWFDDCSLTPILDQFIELLPSKGPVLDVGCGPGRDVCAMQARGVLATGIDSSFKMVCEARARVPGRLFRTMNMINLKFPDHTFTGIWACASVQHLPRGLVGVALNEFSRVIKIGGVLFVTVEEGSGQVVDELGRWRTLYPDGDFKLLLEVAGFEIIRDWRAAGDRSTLPHPRLKRWLEFFARKL